MLAYFALAELTEWIPSLLALGAASMIYVAVADLIPGLHKRSEMRESVLQVLLISSGIASIAIVQMLVGE
jgi:zinc and cadmium transporter